MKNRIASLFLVFALLMSLCNFAVARDNRINVQSGGAERFTDVPTSHWAYAYINKVVGSGLFNGKTPTTFEPSNAMTRSQFVMVMARMEGRSDLEGVETQTIFPDVTTTRRAAGPIKWATDEGFVNGFGDGTFKPDSPITRGQFAALIHRYIVAKRYTNLHVVDPEPAQFTDAASVSTAFTSDVEYARIHGLLTGYSDGTVRAGNPITRAAIAAILARFLDLVTESGYTPLLDGPVIDGGDSGDSGDTSSLIEYDDVKLTVSGSTHGKTTLKVTRDGKDVAADDVQAGDLVTVTHEPDSGYGVSVRVRDAKNKTVKKTTNSKTYTTTFKVPNKNLPVTVTVTYSKSGGGGGGGGGSSTGGGYNPTPTPQNYTLILNASVSASADSVQHGRVFLTKDTPTESTALPTNIQDLVQDTLTVPAVSATAAPSFTYYAVFAAERNYELKAENITVTPADAWNKTSAEVTHIHTTADNNLYYVTLTKAGVVTSANPDVTVTGMFTLIDSGSSENPPATDKFTWTLNANVTGGYVAISKTPFTDAQKQAVLTANGTLTDSLADLVTKDAQNADTVNKFYVAVSPDMRHAAADPNLTPTAANAKVTVTKTETLLDNTLYLYEVTITGIDANVTTTLNGSFAEAANASAFEYNVDVSAVYLNANGGEITAPSDALAPESDKDTAKKTDTVTVTVPVPDGFSVDSVTVNGNAITADTEASTATVMKYPFTMPESDAAVVVTYKALPADEQLNFKVNVTFEGEGSIALNVAGKEYMFNSSDAATTDPTFTMLKSEYDAQYPNGIPAYLVSTIPATAKGYKFDGITAPAGFANTTATSPNTSLTDTNTTLNVTVKFVREYAYGYNLTVIGDGSARVKLGSKDFSSETSGSLLTTAQTVDLIVDATAGDTSKPVDDFFKVLINDEPWDVGEAYSLNTPGTVEIIVAFLPKEATIVPFTVELVGNGTVAIRLENGPFTTGLKPTEDTLNASTSRTAQVSASSRTFTGWAWSGTIITLTPNLGENSVVKSIVVDEDTQIRDELPANGFSYSLVDAAGRSNHMVVTTAAFGEYQALVQAPYKGELANGDLGLHSASQGINKNATLEAVLYSLNNGLESSYSGSTSFTEVNNIKNNIGSTLGMLPKIIQLYLYDPSTGQKTSSAEQLESKLNKGVEASITDNIGNMIDSQKDTMISGAEDNIKDTLERNLRNVNIPAPDTDSMKPGIIQQILNNSATPDNVKRAYAAGQITDSNFNVNLTVTPLKLESDETSANVTDQAKAKGKSLQAQIVNKLVREYLRDPDHVDIQGADNMGLVPHVTLDTRNATLSRGVLTIPISASATVTNPPSLKQDPSFTQFMTKSNGELDLDVWAVVKVTASVTLPTGSVDLVSASNPLEVFKQVTLDANSQEVRNIKTQLDVVSTTLANAWTDKWNELTDEDEDGKTVLNIALNEVITADMLERIINGKGDEEGLMTPALNRIAIDSLGDATATRSKFMSLYNDLVYFKANDKNQLDKLQLKTKSGEYKDLVTVDGRNLKLVLNLNSFFKDTEGNDQTSFELLVDLLVGLRDGIATDIRNETNQSPKPVISDMIRGQLSSGSRKVTATKWGASVSSTNMTNAERKELADLLAELVMQEDIKTKTLHDAWANFEAKGYSAVSFEMVGMPNNADIRNALTNSGYGFSANTSLVGLKLERTTADN